MEKRPSNKDAFHKSVFLLFEKIIRPKAKDEDSKRREFILNILLLSSIFLSGISFVIILYQSIKFGTQYKGNSVGDFSLIFFGFIILYLLSRAKLFVYISYFFIAIMFFLLTAAAYHWGSDVPAVLLGYALVIVMSGVLVSTTFSFVVVSVIIITIILITHLQLIGFTHPALYWKPETLGMKDAIQFSITLFIIAIVSWLSNREIERSLVRARKSEAELKEERDTLEVRVQERTRDLEKVQMEKMNQAARFIEFGKISSGLFHDLINHMTSLFFDIEKANDAGKKEQAHAKEYLRQANETKDVLMEYIEAAKRQLQNQKTDSPFSMKKEILRIVRILGYKLKMEKVEIILMSEFDIITYGNSIKFNQVITNVVLNALDAYENSEQSRRQINIQLDKYDNKAIVSIEDWAGGISEDIQDKIFEPFFTTKGLQEGTGIGLTIVKNIIENNFGGTIKVESVWGQGSKFIIEIPMRDSSLTTF